MGISNKVRTGKSSPSGKPKSGGIPSATGKLVTPKSKATGSKGG